MTGGLLILIYRQSCLLWLRRGSSWSWRVGRRDWRRWGEEIPSLVLKKGRVSLQHLWCPGKLLLGIRVAARSALDCALEPCMFLSSLGWCRDASCQAAWDWASPPSDSGSGEQHCTQFSCPSPGAAAVFGGSGRVMGRISILLGRGLRWMCQHCQWAATAAGWLGPCWGPDEAQGCWLAPGCSGLGDIGVWRRDGGGLQCLLCRQCCTWVSSGPWVLRRGRTTCSEPPGCLQSPGEALGGDTLGTLPCLHSPYLSCLGACDP